MQLLCHTPSALKTVHLTFMLQVFTSPQPSASECRIETLPETLRHSIDAVSNIKEQYRLLCVRSAMLLSLKTSLSRNYPDVYAKAVTLVLSRPALPPIDELLPFTHTLLPSMVELRSGLYMQLRNCTNPAYSTLQLMCASSSLFVPQTKAHLCCFFTVTRTCLSCSRHAFPSGFPSRSSARPWCCPLCCSLNSSILLRR